MDSVLPTVTAAVGDSNVAAGAMTSTSQENVASPRPLALASTTCAPAATPVRAIACDVLHASAASSKVQVNEGAAAVAAVSCNRNVATRAFVVDPTSAVRPTPVTPNEQLPPALLHHGWTG